MREILKENKKLQGESCWVMMNVGTHADKAVLKGKKF